MQAIIRPSAGYIDGYYYLVKGKVSADLTNKELFDVLTSDRTLAYGIADRNDSSNVGSMIFRKSLALLRPSTLNPYTQEAGLLPTSIISSDLEGHSDYYLTVLRNAAGYSKSSGTSNIFSPKCKYPSGDGIQIPASYAVLFDATYSGEATRLVITGATQGTNPSSAFYVTDGAGQTTGISSGSSLVTTQDYPAGIVRIRYASTRSPSVYESSSSYQDTFGGIVLEHGNTPTYEYPKDVDDVSLVLTNASTAILAICLDPSTQQMRYSVLDCSHTPKPDSVYIPRPLEYKDLNKYMPPVLLELNTVLQGVKDV